MRAREEGALSVLGQLSRDEATGELVCATRDSEVHVHLQEGRVAWATSSTAVFGFSRYIVERCELDADAFRELVDECRRHRKPFGETLIEWGLASPEVVREALERQIREALGGLHAAGDVSHVFLPRGAGYQTYNRDLTFELSRVLPRTRRRPVSSQRLPRAVLLPDASLSTKLILLRTKEPGIRWIERHRDGRVERLPADGQQSGLRDVGAAVFSSGATFAAVRGERENLIGVALADGAGQLWCGVDSDVVLAAMILMLRQHLPTAKHEADPETVAPGGPFRVLEDRGIPGPVLTDLMQRTPDLWGVTLTSGDGVSHPLARRDAIDPDALLGPVEPAKALLRARASAGEGLAVKGTSTVLASPRVRVHGGRLLDGTSRCVWLLLDPRAGDGLGWALVTTLLRHTTRTMRDLT